MTKVRIGIDPAFRKDGFAIAIYDSSDRTINCKMFSDVLEFYNWLLSDESPQYAKCIIENSNLQNSTFDKCGNRSELMRKSRNVGANQAASQLTVTACTMVYGKENVIEISPKNKGVKLSKSTFLGMLNSMNITYLPKRNNQDFRDASKLALRKF